MEKLELSKKEEEDRLAREGLVKATQDVPATIEQYQEFLRVLAHLADVSDSAQIKEKIIRALIRKVWITETGFKLEYLTGVDYIEMEQRMLEPEIDIPDNYDFDKNPTPPWGFDDLSDSGQNKSRNQNLVPGSNSLTNGGFESGMVPTIKTPFILNQLTDGVTNV